jgi:hypothetical protein
MRAVEVSWRQSSDREGTETHVRWACVKTYAGPVPPESIVILSSEEDDSRVFHHRVVTAPECYLVGLDGETLLFAFEVESDDDDGRYELVNRLFGVTLDQLVDT